MPPKANVTHFGLIRHAETRWNREKKIQGQADSPLTASGRRQAGHWGQLLKPLGWDFLLASDSPRALQTAVQVNRTLDVPLTTDSRLREQDWGRWTAMTLTRLKRDEPAQLAEQVAAGWRFCPPGGEDRISVRRRSLRALQQAAARWAGRRLLVVTHEGVIKCLLYHLAGRRFLPTEAALIRPYHLHRLVWDQNGLRLQQVNALALEAGGVNRAGHAIFFPPV